MLFVTNAKKIIVVLLLGATACHHKMQPPVVIDLKYSEPVPVQLPTTVVNTTGNKAQKIQIKYASFLRVPPDSVNNIRLYTFIDSWLNTPYKWGGTTRDGIDCSAFIQRLLADVYNIRLPRTSVEQFYTRNIEPFGSRHFLREGDLVFFHHNTG